MLNRKFPNAGKILQRYPVKRISGQDHFFMFKLPFELQSFISGVDEYVQILRMAIQLQQMCNCDSLNCVQNKIKIVVVQKMVLCCGGIQIENMRGADSIRWDKVKQGRNVPEGGNNALRRQRCAKNTFLGQNRILVSQRRINTKCELWGWSYAFTSCNPAFLYNHAHECTFSLNSLSHVPGAAWGVFPVPRSCLLCETVIPSFILFYYFIPSSSLLVPQYSLFPSITLSFHHSFPSLFPSITLSLHSHSHSITLSLHSHSHSITLSLHHHLTFTLTPSSPNPQVGRWWPGGLVVVSPSLLSPLLHYSLLLLTTTTTPPGTTWDYRPCALVLLRGCGAWVGEAGVGVGAWVGWIAGWWGGGYVEVGQCINVGEYIVDIVQQ
ncbi:Hypothetical_protein [Hexamita inflata]|uniref:Hypothetical_protein n=1 Tax=Hexamita inflata TaxID=28002 RepID=A0AA86THL4_9EUKA|nr:Hypothetical protein HINF_LOCUS5116 [Hexamita inflata]